MITIHIDVLCIGPIIHHYQCHANHISKILITTRRTNQLKNKTQIVLFVANRFMFSYSPNLKATAHNKHQLNYTHLAKNHGPKTILMKNFGASIIKKHQKLPSCQQKSPKQKV